MIIPYFACLSIIILNELVKNNLEIIKKISLKSPSTGSQHTEGLLKKKTTEREIKPITKLKTTILTINGHEEGS